MSGHPCEAILWGGRSLTSAAVVCVSGAVAMGQVSRGMGFHSLSCSGVRVSAQPLSCSLSLLPDLQVEGLSVLQGTGPPGPGPRLCRARALGHQQPLRAHSFYLGKGERCHSPRKLSWRDCTWVGEINFNILNLTTKPY